MPRFSHCPECGAELDPTLPDCQSCGFMPSDPVVGEARDPVERARSRRFPIPWGLLILLGLYFGGVWLYVRWEHQNSPQYVAARHLRAAEQLLGGSDNGRTAEVRALFEALDNLLAALRAVPEDRWTHQRVEVVVLRLRERGAKLSPETQKEVDSISLRFRKFREGRTSNLPIGPRDMWDVDAVLDMPSKVLRYSSVGGLLIFAFWLYWTIQDRKYASRLELERQDDRKRNLAGLVKQRRRSG